MISSRLGSLHRQIRNCLAVVTIWSWAPDGRLTPRETGRLTVGRNIILACFMQQKLPEKKVVGLERGPLSLVSTTEELLDRKVAAPL
jgi:hypothetical protein